MIHFDRNTPLIEASGGWAQIASRPEGGACHFLRNSRCQCHAVRPATCGEFPLTVHAGQRVQVSLVLSCPGVELSGLIRRAEVPPFTSVSSDFRSEVEYVEQELLRAAARGQLRWAAQRRRRVERSLRQEGRWESEEEIRARLRPRLDQLIPTQLRGPDLIDGEPLESLPLFFDDEFGRVAFRTHPGGIELFSLREQGGIDRNLGVFAPPQRAPVLDGPARNLLKGYIHYFLERDATVGAAYDRAHHEGTGRPGEIVVQDLAAVAAQVLRLAVIRRSLGSDRRGELSIHDVENGIRATDMDILDRPTTGLRL